MNCPREAEVWQAIENCHWPERCDDELRAHVAGCEDCADLAEVGAALTAEHDDAVRAARVPSSGAVWWRAQMRARQDAARTARRAMYVVQAVAVAVAVVVLALVLGPSLPAVHWTLPIIIALASPLLLAPLAVYLVVTGD